MGYIPIFLDVTGRESVVVGGGEVAARKVEALLEAGARVTVVSPSLSPALKTLVARRLVTHIAREYQRGDIRGCVLVYAATDDPKLHRELAAEARALGIPINVVDVPELCTFISPAVVKRGELQIAISTGGASPAFAARLRRALEDQFGAEYALTLEVLRAARRRLHAEEIDPADRMRRLKELADSALPDAIAAGDDAAIERILVSYLGDGVGLAALGLALAKDLH
ncbi:MAG: bifunctional precorrin-2 dehydrogenase/sirohydrochlorin ferrochelatase [Candidatus Binatus sp.]|uniref:precorrin-2 dehydrogenase/sirohydrochlorin ferrochelatase family protein n=1 Tax=Candidatus Binatus sp. TaxID=2811406 RepID=UPI003BB04520